MSSASVYKLGLLAHKKKFPRLPEQQDEGTYGVIWGVFGKDPRETCYVVRFVDKTEVKLLAYVNVAGEVYRTSEPVKDKALPDQPDMQLVLDTNNSKSGMVTVKGADGILRMRCYCDGSPEGAMRERSEAKTWNSTRSMPYGEFMASLFLRYVHFASADELPKGNEGVAATAGATGLKDVLGTVQLDEPVEIFNGFSAVPLSDAVDMLLYRVDKKERPAGIESYARRVLSELDLAKFKAAATRLDVGLARLDRSNNFFFNYVVNNADDEEAACLSSAEAALNRLSSILDQMDCGLNPTMSSPSEEGCSLIDQLDLFSVTGEVAALVKRVNDENPWTCPGTIPCAPGGEWDVRTRFVHLVEALNVITRLDYRYGVNTATGELAVWFASTPADAMPHTLWSPGVSAWRDLSTEERGAWAREHDARVTLVLAAAAFASGPALNSVYVRAGKPKKEASQGSVYRFSRAEFMATFVPLAAELNGEGMGDAPCLAVLDSVKTNEHFPYVAPPMSSLNPCDDPRDLPQALRELLLADKASELEVMEDPDDPHAARLVELRVLVDDDPQKAADGYVDLIGELEASCVVRELMAETPVQSQFCEGYLARILWPLTCSDPDMRVLRAPDALYFAQSALAELFAHAGDLERALPEVRKLYDMAPSSMQAHYQMINVLARLEMFDEVVEVCKHALRLVVDRGSVGYLFYRMAFAYWQLGRCDMALACYRLVPKGDEMADVTKEEMHALMDEMGIHEAPDFDAAVAKVGSEGVELPPANDVCVQIANAAVLLTDAGFFKLAARCVLTMWSVMGNDELGSMARSLEDGFAQ